MAVLVGREAPDFTVAAVSADGQIVESFNLKEAIKNKYGLVFFYPLDFPPAWGVLSVLSCIICRCIIMN